MGLPLSYGIEKNRNSMDGLSAYENGGKGSGNFGHSGRPGEVGGSAPSGSSSRGFSMDSPEVAACEEMGWSVTDTDNGQVELEKWSDLGEDLVFYADKDDFVGSVRDLAKQFDPDEHVSLWLDENGEVKENLGIPTQDPDDVYEDARNIKDQLEQLATEVEKRHKVETVKSKLDEVIQAESKAWDRLQGVGKKPSMPTTDEYDRQGGQTLRAISERGHYDDKKASLKAEYDKLNKQKKELESELSESDLHDYYQEEAMGKRPYQKKK